MFLGREQPCFLNFYSNIPVDVVRVKFYVNRLFHPAAVPMRVSIKKIYFVLKRVVSGVGSRVRKRRTSGYVQVGCPTHVLWSSSLADVDFTAFKMNLVNHAILFSWLVNVFRSY